MDKQDIQDIKNPMHRGYLCSFKFQRLAQHGLEGIGLANEAEVVGVRTVGGAFAVLAEQRIAAEVVKMCHAIQFQLLVCFAQSSVVGVVMFRPHRQ